MRRLLRLLAVLLGLCVVYLIAFPVPTGPELVLHRTWALSASDEPVRAASGAETLVPVVLPDSFAYISLDGEVRFRNPTGHAVALADYGFIQYGRTPEQLILQDTNGSYVATIAQAGYPKLTAEGVFVRSGNDSVVSAYTPEGAFRWRVETQGPVASIRTGGELTILGLLAGGILVVDSSGSRIPMDGITQSHSMTAFSTMLDPQHGNVAAIYGPADAALVLFDYRADRLVPTLRVALRTTPGSRIPLEVAGDGEYLLFPDVELRIVRLATGAEAAIQTRVPVDQIHMQAGPHLIGALGIDDRPDPQRGFRRPTELTLFDREGVVPVRAEFAANSASLVPVAGSICLVLDDRVLSFTVAEE